MTEPTINSLSSPLPCLPAAVPGQRVHRGKRRQRPALAAIISFHTECVRLTRPGGSRGGLGGYVDRAGSRRVGTLCFVRDWSWFNTPAHSNTSMTLQGIEHWFKLTGGESLRWTGQRLTASYDWSAGIKISFIHQNKRHSVKWSSQPLEK